MRRLSDLPAWPLDFLSAAAVLALARQAPSRALTPRELLAVGHAVARCDVSSMSMTIGRKQARVPRGVGLAALQVAMEAACVPQRIRIGKTWVKDAHGKVAWTRPVDLPPADAIHFVRSLFYRELRTCVGTGTRRSTDDSLGPEGTRLHQRPGLWSVACRAPNPEEQAIRAQTLAIFAASLGEFGTNVLDLWRAGFTQAEIATRLNTSDRTVRREVQRIKAASRAFDPEVQGRLPVTSWSAVDGPPDLPEGLRALLRPMTQEERNERAGYAESGYRRLATCTGGRWPPELEATADRIRRAA